MERDPAWKAGLLGAVLCLAVFLLYEPVRTHEFVSYDDHVYVTQNPHLARGLDWGAIGWVFSHEHAANYHPLTWVSHMLDVELFGLEPGPHHLVNVALHALNALLVLFLSRALLGNLWAAALAAALFAVHPLRVESVAWASERKDVLCASFFLAGAWLYLLYGRRPSPARYAFVLLATLGALLAKPMAVTLPFVYVLLDAWPLARAARARPWRAREGRPLRLWLEKLPLFALAALAAISTWLAQEVGGAVSGMVAVPFELRVWNALASLGVYLFQTVWPARLAPFYPLAALVEESPRAVLLAPALVSLALVTLVGVLAWRLRERAPWVLFAWCWFLGLLVPVSGLKQVGMQAHADRYTYLPLLGAAWIAAGATLALQRRWPSARALLLGLSVVAVSAAAWRTRAQVRVWHDTRTLFEHALRVTDKNYVAHAALAAEALESGDPGRARAEAEAALALYALEPNALTTLAQLELEEGDAKSAEALLQRAKQVQASKYVRYHMARVKLALGNLEAAAREFAAALELDPSLVDAHFNLGQVLFRLGRPEEARAAFEHALALTPEHAGAHNGLGVLALEAGDLSAAEERFRRAVAADPEYADAHHNLGVVLERTARASAAQAEYQRARELERERP
jgi:tetratricopeptide (TPR) repeat protein